MKAYRLHDDTGLNVLYFSNSSLEARKGFIKEVQEGEPELSDYTYIKSISTIRSSRVKLMDGMHLLIAPCRYHIIYNPNEYTHTH